MWACILCLWLSMLGNFVGHDPQTMLGIWPHGAHNPNPITQLTWKSSSSSSSKKISRVARRRSRHWSWTCETVNHYQNKQLEACWKIVQYERGSGLVESLSSTCSIHRLSHLLRRPLSHPGQQMGPLPCARGHDTVAVRSQQRHTAQTGPDFLEIVPDLWSVSGGLNFWRVTPPL